MHVRVIVSILSELTAGGGGTTERPLTTHISREIELEYNVLLRTRSTSARMPKETRVDAVLTTPRVCLVPPRSGENESANR